MFANKTKLFTGWIFILVISLPSLVMAQGENGVRRALILGDSLSVGWQPDANGVGMRTDEGYADQLLPVLEAAGYGGRKLKLIKLGCPGESTVTMQQGGICAYDEGSQLAQALVALRAHKDKVAFIAIDLGANDILDAGCVGPGGVNVVCVVGALNQIAQNLPVIMGAIRQAAPNTPIVGMTIYNPFLAAWLQGPAGQGLAFSSAGLQVLLNQQTLIPIYTAFGAKVADVEGAFNSQDFFTQVPLPPFGLVPLNVATLCALTYNCTPAPQGPDIHPNSDGYGVIASAFAAELLP